MGSMITQCTCHVLVCSARDPDRPSGLPMDLVCGIFHTAGSNSSNMVWHRIFLNIIADHIFNLFGDSILVSHVSLSCRNRSFIYLFIYFFCNSCKRFSYALWYRMLSGACRCKGNENVKIDKQKYTKG